MTLLDFDRWVKSLLALDECRGRDISLNGIQIGPDEKEIRKVAFAVDASLESIEKAAQWGADLLFVHHGLFWGKPLAIRGSHYKRIDAALKGGVSLYAVHLPLDMHAQLGNNGAIAAKLELEELEAFGDYQGLKIGWKGRLARDMTCDDIVQRLFGGYHDINLLSFGPEKIRTLGIVSGGASRIVEQAVDESLDLYITGEPSHETYHYCQEQGINVLAAGHYQTETFGVRQMAARAEEDLKLECIFLDIPTGL